MVGHAHSSTEIVGDDPLRSALRQMWASVAPSWAEHAAYVDARGEPVARAMLEAADPRPGERVLELACGPGGVGLAASERVGPAGAVVLSDVAGEMTAVAAARAEALGLANVTTRQLDLERIDEPDASYDVVVCREGLM
ncbi:MAG: class I SAM-dependent methyltransferase, partial [Acidimicrobiales bacterium]